MSTRQNKRVSKFQVELSRIFDSMLFINAALERILPFSSGSMTPRERVRRAVEMKNPDRVPHIYRDTFSVISITPKNWQPAEGYYPYVHPLEVLYGGWQWSKRKDSKWLKEDRTAIDEFGTVWHAGAVASMGEPIKGPLEDGWHLLENFSLPDMKNPDRMRFAKKMIGLAGTKRHIIAFDLNSLGPWELFRHLRGFQNAMMDLVMYPDEVKKLLGMMADMFCDVVDAFAKLGVSEFRICDDWGTQTSSFISPQHFREFFMPCYKKIADRCHSHGMYLGIHSCGQIRVIVPLLIESGFDILQLDSPNMCGIDWLAENAAGKICIWGGVDIQTVYSSNDKRIIEDYVKKLISKLSSERGGFVAQPYTQPYDIGVAYSTVRAQLKYFKKYGSYAKPA